MKILRGVENMEQRSRTRNQEYEKLDKEEYTYETVDSYQNPRENAIQAYTMEEYMAEIVREKLQNQNHTKERENLEKGYREERRK